MNTTLERLLQERGPIQTVGVVGMGYVGIPSAVLFANSPYYSFVYGFQRPSPTSGYKIEMLNRGEYPIRGEEPEIASLVQKAVESRKFHCTSDFSKVGDCDAITIAIQTPFRNPRDLIPDFTPLEEGTRQVGRHILKGSLIVIESTITPGTTNGMVRTILEEESGLGAGIEFALAHAPERVMPGRLVRNMREHDRIIGGIDPVSTERAKELIAPILTRGKIIPMTALAAEVTKTAENTFRDLQIAAANELALYCEAVGVNVYDVREGVASLKEEGVSRGILWPGAGVGGHCLPKDTYHLERGVKVLGRYPLDYPDGKESLFILARTINDFMPHHMWHLTVEGLKRIGKICERSRIALLGWAYIPNSDDARNTPSELYLVLAKAAGAGLKIHDPYVEQIPDYQVSNNLEEVLEGADAIALFTGHSMYRTLDPCTVRTLSGTEHPVVVDGRNILDPDHFIREGFVYKGIGRGDKNHHEVVNR